MRMLILGGISDLQTISVARKPDILNLDRDFAYYVFYVFKNKVSSVTLTHAIFQDYHGMPSMIDSTQSQITLEKYSNSLGNIYVHEYIDYVDANQLEVEFI
jgi:hypothetical protein